MDKKSSMRLRALELAAELAKAEDAIQVGRLLKQAAIAQIPDGALKSAGKNLPGYHYDKGLRRYIRRVEAAARSGGLAVDATLAGRAVSAFPAIEQAYGVIVDSSFPWSLASPNKARVSGPAATRINNTASVKGRAEIVRADLSVREATLGTANPKGLWPSLPNGSMGGAAAAEILSRSLGTQAEPQVKTVGQAMWGVHPASEAALTPLVYRREPLLEVTHPDIPVVRTTRRGSRPIVGDATRAYTLFKDTVFAAEPDVVALVDDHEMLEEIYAAGEDMGDMMVPAAGILVVRQLVGVEPRT